MGISISLIGVVVIAVLLARSCLSLLSPTRKIPGPFAARFSRLWYLVNVWRGKFEIVNQELHKKMNASLLFKYLWPAGPIVRIAPNQYSIDDPNSIKTIYGHGTKFIKSPWYDASGNPHSNLKDLFTERDPQRHAAFRRKVAGLYSMTSILRMESSADQSIELVIARLYDLSRSGDVVNIPHIMQCFAFDVIGDITLGKRFGFLDKGEDALGIFPSLHGYLKYCATVGVFSEFHTTIFGLMSKFSPGGMGHVLKFVQDQITDRMASPKPASDLDEQGDFLTEVLKLHQKQPEAFTFEHVFITCMTNIGAGSDTTSISLSSVMYHLLKYPQTLQKLRAEVDDKLPTPGARTLTFQEAQKMPYLQACIKEALRMHPATGLPLSRVVPDEGATVGGTYVPKGSIVGVNTWVAHRNESIFGPDAATFRPERWLIDDKDQLSRMEGCYLPFGYGSRTCIGKNISLMEITKLVPRLVALFDFELVGAEEGLQCENVWFVKQKNFQCRVSLRQSS